ncbi:uncharacterized protein LOC135707977 [Ochlerotatus camptorhynchus]|uniref:uncharacterized protein LOC135707977 n=1 Tax=Ochlerotatus camptorhynchus TaxID=644619 RepID=UPI0031CF3E89
MNYIMTELSKLDSEIGELFHSEGIDYVDIFLELNDQDFVRLRLRTKTIKYIQRMQTEIRNAPVFEESVDDTMDATHASAQSDDQTDNNQMEIVEDLLSSDEDDTVDESAPNPYKGIRLEKKINIDRILKRTATGLQIMESLKQGNKPTDKLPTQIKQILCDYLRLNYGIRPSAFHKNLLAISLVDSYSILRSSTPDIPQALWFYPHARGKHRHTGRLHYHLEYLVRKSTDRKIIRSKTIPVPEDQNASNKDIQDNLTDIRQLVEELKFLCPGPNTKNRVEELWLETFADRDRFRQDEEFHIFMQDFPVAAGFDGHW